MQTQKIQILLSITYIHPLISNNAKMKQPRSYIQRYSIKSKISNQEELFNQA